MRTTWMMGLLVLSVGCKKNSDLKIVESVTEVFEQVPSNQVDILWVVDDSASMGEEQERVMNGAAEFITNLDATGMDFHLGVITTQADGPTAGQLLGEPAFLTPDDPDYTEEFRSRVAVGAETDNELESGLEAAILALSSPMLEGSNAGFLREDARLSVIVLSDEDDCSDFGALGADADTFDCYNDGAPLVPVADLIDGLRDAKGIDDHDSLLQLSGIIGPPVSENCPAAVPGDRYAEAIDAVGGLNANICETDYASIMERLGLVAASLQSVYGLTYQADPNSIQVLVTDVDGNSWEVPAGATDGWVYTSGTNLSRLTFDGAGVPPRGSSFAVTYDIATESSEATPILE